MTSDALLNDFALRSFRDVADGDYVLARMACRSGLFQQFLWTSQQAAEKYLKCILLLNRIRAADVGHDLAKAISKIKARQTIGFEVTSPTRRFLERLDAHGRFRYLEISHFAFAVDILTLDRAVWELRRYCTLSDSPRHIKLQRDVSPPKVHLQGGYLERVAADVKHPAREPLLWQNAFFGGRARKTVRVRGGFQAVAAPLSLHPEMLDEVLEYVFLPKEIKENYRAISHAASRK